jgi:hypothetical protein
MDRVAYTRLDGPTSSVVAAPSCTSNFFGHVVTSRDAGGTVNGLTTRYGEKEFAARRLEAR